MNTLKKYILSFLILSFISCKSDIGTITNVKKSVVYPGVPQAETFVRYKADIELYKPVKIVKVILQNKEKEIIIDKFSLISFPNGTLINRNNEIKEGRYFFSANITPANDFENTDDELKFIISVDDKEKVFKVKVKKDKPIYRK